MKKLYENWVNRLRTDKRDATQHREAALNSELQDVYAQINELERGPVELEAEVARLSEGKIRLEAQLSKLSTEEGDNSMQADSLLQSRLNEAVRECRILFDRRQSVRHAQVIREAEEFLASDGIPPLRTVGLPQLRSILTKSSNRFQDVCAEINQSLAGANELTAQSSQVLSEVKQCEAELADLNIEIASLVSELTDDNHMVQGDVVESIRQMRNDDEFLLFLRTKANDLRLERSWGLPLDVLSTFSSR